MKLLMLSFPVPWRIAVGGKEGTEPFFGLKKMKPFEKEKQRTSHLIAVSS